MDRAFAVVIPTIGRSSLGPLLQALGRARGPLPRSIVLVDDRRESSRALPLGPLAESVSARLRMVRSGGRGPAAARNAGWRAATTPWVAFLDDDVVPGERWLDALVADLALLGPLDAGSQGRIRVPRPTDHRPTDWERNVVALENARWATADMAYRTRVLAEVGGFDERFPRAYREDADLALRIVRRGYRIAHGQRWVTHPVRPADRWVSVRLQAGNADDALMAALHGPGWRRAAGVPPGRRPRHMAITVAAGLALIGVAARSPRVAAAGALAWIAGTLEFAWGRIAPGPRTRREIETMLLTSVAIPPVATLHWLRGLVRRRRLLADAARAPAPQLQRERPDAVLFDRDGTLVIDVPYNGDPRRVWPVAGARDAIERLRAHRVRMAVISNQSGIARGVLTAEQVAAVNDEIERRLGPLGVWLICPHGPEDGCPCRKPAPGLVQRAAAILGVDAARCAVIGDTGADVAAAVAAGARAILVPNRVTRVEEIRAAPEVARDLGEAVDRLVGAEQADTVSPRAAA